MLPFTYREIKQAWRQNLEVSNAETRKNTHRLLLFYAVECGLKAVIMKRERLNRTDDCATLSQLGHDLNGLLDYLRAGTLLHLPKVSMSSIENPSTPRQVGAKEFNQMWRYGGKTKDTPTDADIETQLLKVIDWIAKEL